MNNRVLNEPVLEMEVGKKLLFKSLSKPFTVLTTCKEAVAPKQISKDSRPRKRTRRGRTRKGPRGGRTRKGPRGGRIRKRTRRGRTRKGPRGGRTRKTGIYIPEVEPRLRGSAGNITDNNDNANEMVDPNHITDNNDNANEMVDKQPHGNGPALVDGSFLANKPDHSHLCPKKGQCKANRNSKTSWGRKIRKFCSKLRTIRKRSGRIFKCWQAATCIAALVSYGIPSVLKLTSGALAARTCTAGQIGFCANIVRYLTWGIKKLKGLKPLDETDLEAAKELIDEMDLEAAKDLKCCADEACEGVCEFCCNVVCTLPDCIDCIDVCKCVGWVCRIVCCVCESGEGCGDCPA